MKPYTLLALAEPASRYLAYAIKPRKIERTELKKLGRITLARLLLFVSLALASLAVR